MDKQCDSYHYIIYVYVWARNSIHSMSLCPFVHLYGARFFFFFFCSAEKYLYFIRIMKKKWSYIGLLPANDFHFYLVRLLIITRHFPSTRHIVVSVYALDRIIRVSSDILLISWMNKCW